MPKVRFNITTNFRGVEYRRGDEAEMTKADIKLFDDTGSSGMPHIVELKGKKNAEKNATSGDAEASDNSSG